MEALYIKLYEKYSKLKATKEGYLDQLNQEQEVKFLEYVSAAEKLVKHLNEVNKRLSEDVDELRDELVSLRNAKDQQFQECQAQLMEEKQKNQQLAFEMEQLQNLQRERIVSNNRSDDQHEEQQVNSNHRSPTVSRGQTSSHGRTGESSMRITRKRARLLEESGLTISTPAASRDHQSGQKTECCQGIIVNGGPCKCMFQSVLESLIGMKVSVSDQPEGKCLQAVHQSSGYSFTLTWINKPDIAEVMLLYTANSLGTLDKVAPEWMKEDIVFNMSMIPIFFKRVSRVIKPY